MSDHTPTLAGHVLRVSLAALAVFAAVPSLAQQVQDIAPAATQPPLIALPAAGQKPVPASSTASPPVVAEVDLGQAGAVAAGASPAPMPQGVAARAAAAARDSGTPASSNQAAPTPKAKPATKNANRAAASSGTAAPSDRPGVERAVFNRQPVRVGLPVQRERLITLPGPAALHVPADIESVARVEAIDRTIYVTALVPFAPIRIVAELIDGGRQIPLDLVANAQTSGASAELEVFLDRSGSREASVGAAAATEAGPPAADIVELTRFASRMLYAPRRLATTRPGISQVQVSTKPVPGLVRGGLVETAPLGQWRSAGLYVTAVRVTNKSTQPFELPLEHLRGRWLAVTAQHGRIGPAGSETDTTALYLICDRAFDACL